MSIKERLSNVEQVFSYLVNTLNLSENCHHDDIKFQKLNYDFKNYIDQAESILMQCSNSNMTTVEKAKFYKLKDQLAVYHRIFKARFKQTNELSRSDKSFLIEESNNLSTSIRIVDDSLLQGQHIIDSLQNQNSMLTRTRKNARYIIGEITRNENVIKMIKNVRIKNSIIVGSTFFGLFVLTLLYMYYR